MITILTPTEVATILRIQVRAVVRMCRLGLLPGARKPSRAWTIPAAAIAAYRARQSAPSPVIESPPLQEMPRIRGWDRQTWRGVPADSGVYALRVSIPGGPIKIGYGRDIRKRCMALQTGNHEALEMVVYFPGEGARLERELHLRFEKYRDRGEWFRCPESVIDELRGLPGARVPGR